MAIHAGNKYGIEILRGIKEIIKGVSDSNVLHEESSFLEGDRKQSHANGVDVIADAAYQQTI
jgi:hypothetical protein